MSHCFPEPPFRPPVALVPGKGAKVTRGRGKGASVALGQGQGAVCCADAMETVHDVNWSSVHKAKMFLETGNDALVSAGDTDRQPSTRQPFHLELGFPDEVDSLTVSDAVDGCPPVCTWFSTIHDKSG